MSGVHGGQNNNHEINFLKVESVLPIKPDLKLASAPPAGVGVVDPGTDLPPVTVPVTMAGSGLRAIETTVTSSSDDADLLSDNKAVSQLRWYPTTTAATTTPVDASDSPTATTAGVPVTGMGPYTVGIVDGASSRVGSLTPGAGASVVLTPAPGVSGLLQGRYTVTDADGGTSAPSSVTLRVQPVASPMQATIDSGATAVLAPSTPPLGTGPFTYELTGVPASAKNATINPLTGQITATPVDGFSGTMTLTYRAIGADGVGSEPAPAVVTVRPSTSATSTRVVLDEDGDAQAVVTPPAPTGTAPFTWSFVGGDLDSDLDGATATIDPDSGEITVTADRGVSGSHVVQYVVTDAAEVESQPREVTVVVAPTASDVSETGVADEELEVHLPEPVGSGPFTYAVQQPSTGGGSTAVDAASGTVTFDPEGTSGLVSFGYTVTDANGVVSDTLPVTLQISPVASPVSGSTTASRTPAAVALTPDAPRGTGPMTWDVATDLDPAVGTLSVEDGVVHVTPAAGFSGTLSAAYSVTDPEGFVSAPAPVTLDVHPASQDSTGTGQSGQETVVALPTPVGHGPFTMALVTPLDPAYGTVEFRNGNVVFRASRTYSGVLPLRYVVTDAAGLTSEPVTATLTVRPAAPSASTPTVADRPGNTGEVVGPIPTPDGTGPFTYELDGTPGTGNGTTRIDPNTGVIRFTPKKGWSGVATVSYVAVDADGRRSAPATVTFVVTPTAAPVPTTRTTAGKRVHFQLPAGIGTGPLTWALAALPTVDQGTLSIDPRTGAVTFAPADGYTGTLNLSYTVTDASGLVSRPEPLRIEVQPVAEATPSSPAVGPSTAEGTTPTRLSYTGTEATPLVLAGLGLIVTGGVLMLATRRRRIVG